MTTREAIEAFYQESFDLAMASEETIREASDIMDHHGDDAAASDIFARWDDYQEELRILAAEFM